MRRTLINNGMVDEENDEEENDDDAMDSKYFNNVSPGFMHFSFSYNFIIIIIYSL